MISVDNGQFLYVPGIFNASVLRVYLTLLLSNDRDHRIALATKDCTVPGTLSDIFSALYFFHTGE